MNLMDLLNGTSGFDSSVKQMGERVGLSPEQTNKAAAALIPALMGGLKQQKGAGDLGGLLSQFGVTPGNAINDQTTDMGNQILGRIFGSKEVSRQVAAKASANTGIGADQLKKLLPMLASLSAGALASRAGSQQQGGGLLDMLDFDGDGNPLDDIAGLASKLFGR
jgi:hypothetical protein